MICYLTFLKTFVKKMIPEVEASNASVFSLGMLRGLFPKDFTVFFEQTKKLKIVNAISKKTRNLKAMKPVPSAAATIHFFSSKH